WDIRPKPEFGTIEIRVFDTPLTIERAAALSGFVQSLGAWFLADQPFMPQEDDYLVYTYNRFQACRFGMDAVYVDPATGDHMPLRERQREEQLLAEVSRQAARRFRGTPA
ncbi:MAG: glutamate--cysteine ligase, partial [Nitrospirota bacterium]